MLDQSQCPSSTATCVAVDETLRSRRSVRAFLPTAVPQALVAEILNVAASSPSGVNTQPWQVIALAGSARQQLVERVMHAYLHEHGQHHTRPSLLNLTWVGGAKMVLICTACSASPKAITLPCSIRPGATTNSSMRR